MPNECTDGHRLQTPSPRRNMIGRRGSREKPYHQQQQARTTQRKNLLPTHYPPKVCCGIYASLLLLLMLALCRNILFLFFIALLSYSWTASMQSQGFTPSAVNSLYLFLYAHTLSSALTQLAEFHESVITAGLARVFHTRGDKIDTLRYFFFKVLRRMGQYI